VELREGDRRGERKLSVGGEVVFGVGLCVKLYVCVCTCACEKQAV
jgi:hypothetical protein